MDVGIGNADKSQQVLPAARALPCRQGQGAANPVSRRIKCHDDDERGLSWGGAVKESSTIIT